MPLNEVLAVLDDQIARLREDLQILEDQRNELLRRIAPREPTSRFYEMAPLKAMRILLDESGRALTREELYRLLVEGGNTRGRKKAKHNIAFSFRINLENGNLREVNGRIGLPEWGDERFGDVAPPGSN